ncbi:fusarubin cluster-polyketide synthase [Pleosporales sp. CAS-2024a]
MAMTTLWQLGTFILRHQTGFPDAQSSIVLGLCTGSFAAAAVSCSRNKTELIPAAIEAVIASFRTGKLVDDVARRVSASTGVDDSWSVLVEGAASARLVEQFNATSTLPSIRKPYISAYAPNAICVSGPPDVLPDLIASDGLKSLNKKTIPIFGPYHAGHLYSADDPSKIASSLQGSSGFDAMKERMPFLPNKESPRPLLALIEEAVAEVLLRPIQWDTILGSLQQTLQSTTDLERFSIVPFGTIAQHLIYSALKKTGLESKISSESLDSSLPQSNPALSSGLQKPKLAIIGMSGRFPDAKNNDEYWDILRQGLDVHKVVPPLHWDVRTHVDTSAKPRKNTSATPYGCWLKDPEQFDARFFNISPKEAPQIDPAQRLALMTAYEAIERAGIVPDATPSTRPDRVGVFYGVTSNDWMETNSAQDIDAHMIPGGNRAFIPGRINYFFKFSGPSYAVDTACSSSLAGIHLACNSLWAGDIDTAIAGGTNVLTNPDFTAGLDRGHFLSRTGNCKTFDDGADGYCRGEGIATVIIKRLDDALADGDPILGLILGAYTNHSAESESITRPHVGAQRAIFSKILNEACVDPYSVSYVEMHGTGTQAGDAVEMASVLETFAPSGSKRMRTDEEALYLGSAKANIGHGEAASGATGLIKVLMMMEKNLIVPHCGIKTRINQKFPTDLDKRRVRIARELTKWEKRHESAPRRVFINNFSAAGGNSVILLEDAPPKQEKAVGSPDSRQQLPVAVTAKVGTSMQGNLKSLLEHLQSAGKDASLGALSYTTTARRIHHPHRVLLLGATIAEVCDKIKAAIRDNAGVTRPKGSPRVIFSFTGQGAQYPGMAQQLLKESSVFRTELRRLDQIVTSLGFPSPLPFIETQEQDVTLFQPSVIQMASICVQIALVKLWASWNILPTAVVGHSLGEYAALNTAGVLSDADTIYLVGVRARLLETMCTPNTHAMLVVDGPVDKIAVALAGASYETACINSPTETVLAGPTDQMPGLQEKLKSAGMRSTLLKVPYAFHSSQVDAILPEFTKQAQGVVFSDPKIPVIRPYDCKILTEGGQFHPEYLANHSRGAVNMLEALVVAQKSGVVTDRSVFVEAGPHPAVSKMVKATLGSSVASIASLQRGSQPWEVLVRALKTLYDGGANINWANYQRDFKQHHQVISLPSYAWDLKPYWIQYVNDWSLYKGDAPATKRLELGTSLESTTIHSIVSESGDSKKTKIIVEADIARKDLSPLVQGHEVDGIPLCTPSVYADMALSLGTYLLARYQPNQAKKLVDVSDMDISKALILNEQVKTQPIQVHAEADWNAQTVAMKFMSFNNHGKLQEHSRCVVHYQDGELKQQLQKRAAETKAKMKALRDGIALGKSARYNRAMVYRAIRPLARFHDDYRAIDEIVLNSQTLEAMSTLSFGSVKRDGVFHTHPAIIDSLTQACGFAMNCNDGTDLDVEVFMNHGWGSLQLFEPMDFEKVYTTYTRMQPGPDKLWRGDSTIFDGDRVVAHFGQIALQGVPRRVLKVILSLESGKKSQPAAAQRPAAAAPPAPKVVPVLPVQGPLTPPAEEFASKELSSGPSPITVAMEIISEESGVAVSELTDDTNFADVGVDSLLGLTISARFQEQLDIDLDFNGLFFEHPTVKDLKQFLYKTFPNANPTTTAAENVQSHTTTAGHDVSREPTTPAARAPEPPVAQEESFNVDWPAVLKIISEESGIDVADLDDDANLADCGVDSLLALIIASRFRNELDIELESETIFLDHPTVGDLKKKLLGNPQEDAVATTPNDASAANGSGGVNDDTNVTETSGRDDEAEAALKAALPGRKAAVDALVAEHIVNFSAPTFDDAAPLPNENEKVVIVTGGTGSLGGHLVYHLAQLPDVKTVICLNRAHREDNMTRQIKAMRDKGIRFPEALKPKLVILQTDSSLPLLGLAPDEYKKMAASATHLIHQAWPMSATRPLSGFESQFRVMRNLIDFASASASCRPASFQFTFQMVSSIGVVGFYKPPEPAPVGARIHVPECAATIASVIPNGYSEAKWGMELMLASTLSQHPSRVVAQVARLGQIAGSKTSGYWNPMEHFGFLVKSSQTLGALPAVDGDLYWTPVNDVAAALSDVALNTDPNLHFYHVDHPTGQSWAEMNKVLTRALNVPHLIPFDEWLRRVRAAPQKGNPALLLADFLESNYKRMSCGGLVLDVANSLQRSESLRAMGPVSDKVVRKYIQIWKEIGFLDASEEEKKGWDAVRKELWG